MKEGEQIIKKYNEYIDLLDKLNGDKFKWVPVPKFTVVKVISEIFFSHLIQKTGSKNSAITEFRDSRIFNAG